MGVLLVACAEQEARKPIYRSNKKGLEQSIDRNKKINQQQQLLFKKVMEKDSLLKFNSSPVGYWYAYKEKTPNSLRPEQGDWVKFSYTIQTLEGVIIYDEMELGTVDYLVDRRPPSCIAICRKRLECWGHWGFLDAIIFGVWLSRRW